MKMIKVESPRGNLNNHVKETTKDNRKLSRKEYKFMAKQALELALQNAIYIGKSKLNPENEYLEEEPELNKDELEATVTVLETFLEVLKKRSYL